MASSSRPEHPPSGGALSAKETGIRPIERALDAAVLVVKSGGSTAMADLTFANIMAGYGQKRVAAVWRLDFVAARIETDGRSETILRDIGPVGIHLARASAATELGDRIAAAGADSVDFEAEMESLRNLPAPYPSWMLPLAAAAAGGFFSRAAGGDAGAFAIAGTAACIGQLMRGRLQARGLARIGVVGLCSILSGVIAAAGLRLGWSQTSTATLVGSIVYMVPGVFLINGCIDLVSPRLMSVGIERLMDAALVLLALATGVVLGNTLIFGLPVAG